MFIGYSNFFLFWGEGGGGGAWALGPGEEPSSLLTSQGSSQAIRRVGSLCTKVDLALYNLEHGCPS